MIEPEISGANSCEATVGTKQTGCNQQFCEEIEATTGDKVGMACSIFDVLANLFRLFQSIKDI